MAEAKRAAWLRTLDPRIARYVDILDAHGVETFESCEAGDGHCFPEPTVRFHGEKAAGWAALAVAFDHALPVHHIRRYWTVIDGEPAGPKWEMTFRRPALPLADDELHERIARPAWICNQHAPASPRRQGDGQ